ncbi:MAG TPA: sulfite exporter TauE/SafE family protein, partial [Acidobacteriota bacterium]
IFLLAMLYSSVGHAGASGYLAAMALFAISPPLMRPVALVLNILVATIAGVKFYRAGHFSWRLFWPFAITSIPFAYIGGTLTLPAPIYKIIVGVVLLYAGARLLLIAKPAEVESRVIPLIPAVLIGVVIGLLSGLTGVGGGIFLSPLLLLLGWAPIRQISAVAAVFILVNSVAGLLGQIAAVTILPRAVILWGAAAVTGGWIGAEYGSRRLATVTIRQLLSVVLMIAALKMLFV